ncbi:hypothetical protein ACFX15_008854 [Malus domestica]
MGICPSLPVQVTGNLLKMKKRHLLKTKGFIKEMRLVAMKLYIRDQANKGEKDWLEWSMAKWDPTVDGYLKFLVDRKLVYDMLEGIVEKAHFSSWKSMQKDAFWSLLEQIRAWNGHHIFGAKWHQVSATKKFSKSKKERFSKMKKEKNSKSRED